MPTPMRRWFAILLLVLLPLQALWAAAAPYCEHEKTPAASKHLGHHEHEHQEAVPGDVDTDGGSSLPTAGHTDCHVCHGSAVVAAVSVAAASHAFGPEHPALSRVSTLPSPPHPRPERPKWSSLA